MKVVLIDDDEVFREALARSLRRRGHEVWVLENEDVVAKCAEFLPDAVLLDLKMPEDSGLVLLPKIRKVLPNARIVILTGYGSIATALEAVKSGCCDYLTKPADTNQIEAALSGKAKEVEIKVPSLDRVEWEHLQRTLADCNQNISQAARALGINRRSLQRKLAKYPPQK